MEGAFCCPVPWTILLTDEGIITYVGNGTYPECITKGATIGGNKGGAFKKPFLKFFKENLLN